ncbi:MAG: hypothetical protein CVV28_03375 [Methanobacteriales archaeon HGW-Methanobacteriales-1]|jgi:uncharacterized protein (UPF0305 family)|nr:MAG: hypothetical protein CVV28_03375 [Methanobacteriales archaeon HGW-Methanobacteriales-1]
MLKIDNIDFTIPLSKMDLLEILKKEARNIHIKEIMDASGYLKEDAKFMPIKEQKEYIERFTRAFFIRIKDIKEDKAHYEGLVNNKKLNDFLQVMEMQKDESRSHHELCFHKIARIVATYTAFVREESIHPVGTKFPGGFVLRYENSVYYCPVKEKQINTPSALCRFCVSVQDDGF